MYFVTTTTKENNNADLPVYVIAHSMGGFITTAAMSRLPTLINRTVLVAPMLRMKCGMKCLNYRCPLPQTVAYWLTNLSCYLGLGTMHAVGFFKEKSTDQLPLYVYTSDAEEQLKWQNLRMSYPNSLIATCVTNDWVLQSIRAQKKLANRYQFVKTNTLILR